MGLFKSKKSLVACPDNYYVDFCGCINNIRTKQRLIAVHLFIFLNILSIAVFIFVYLC